MDGFGWLFWYTFVKYEVNFIILLPLLSKIICA